MNTKIYICKCRSLRPLYYDKGSLVIKLKRRRNDVLLYNKIYLEKREFIDFPRHKRDLKCRGDADSRGSHGKYGDFDEIQGKGQESESLQMGSSGQSGRLGRVGRNTGGQWVYFQHMTGCVYLTAQACPPDHLPLRWDAPQAQGPVFISSVHGRNGHGPCTLPCVGSTHSNIKKENQKNRPLTNSSEA